MFSKKNYRRSKEIETIPIPISHAAKAYTAELLESTEVNRQSLSEALLDELTDAAKIDIVDVTISNQKQKHRRSKGKIVVRHYGHYLPIKKKIFIHNRTAARGQVLACKTFVDTLLHEWVHHYDHEALGLNSIHSSGFYARLRDIKQKLGYFSY